MEITINGIPADITLETEKTVGELLSGIESWLTGSGHCLSGLELDGETIGAEGVTGVFDRDLGHIRAIDIKTSARSLIMVEALCTARFFVEDFRDAPPEERSRLREAWTVSPVRGFLMENIPDLYGQVDKTLAGEGLSPHDTGILIGERLREIENPGGELANMEPLVINIVQRLEDLPLDIQTGKDGRTAETVSLFSNIAEKLFRIYCLLKMQGYALDIVVEEIPAAVFIDEFSAALKELLAAYETKDVVLIGDLAEYELAPRLFKFYSAMRASASA
jgi:hypothetical protein